MIFKVIKPKEKVGVLLGIVNIVISATNTATKLAKTVAKPSYNLVGDLHGMQGVSGSNPLGSIEFYY